MHCSLEVPSLVYKNKTKKKAPWVWVSTQMFELRFCKQQIEFASDGNVELRISCPYTTVISFSCLYSVFSEDL